MEVGLTDSPVIYSSTFRHGLDEKRRLQVPSSWRGEAEGKAFTVVLWLQHKVGPCLRVFPPELILKLKAQLNAMENTDPKKVILKRIIGGFSIQLPLDKAGRICLPEDLVQKAGIKEQAVLVGMLDQFEIWNPERYEQVLAADTELAPEAFALLG